MAQCPGCGTRLAWKTVLASPRLRCKECGEELEATRTSVIFSMLPVPIVFAVAPVVLRPLGTSLGVEVLVATIFALVLTLCAQVLFVRYRLRKPELSIKS